MLKYSLSRYILLVNTYRPVVDSIVSNLLRPVSADITIPRHGFHTSSGTWSTATDKDQLNESEEQNSAPVNRVPCPDGAKLLRVALIGKPNAGKSTLINALMNIEVCPASMRPHTTRKTQRAIYLEENTQIVFIDTPGVVTQQEVQKFNFDRDFARGPRKSIKNAHLVAVMVDVSNRLLQNKLDKKITTLLNNYPECPAVLVLNKVDLIASKRKLLDVLALLTNGTIGGKPIPIQHENAKHQSHAKMNTSDILKKAAEKERLKGVDGYTARTGTSSSLEVTLKNANSLEESTNENEDPDVRGWPNFQEVFMMSSLTGEGVQSFKDYLIKQAKASSWDYPEEVLTNHSPKDLTILNLKSKILDHCEKDIPYKMTPILEIWEENVGGDLTIGIGILCQTVRVMKTLIGSKGSTISSITLETERSLMKLFRRNVSLHIKVRCPEEVEEKSNMKKN